MNLAGLSWRECFDLDARSRLTRAYTVASSVGECDPDEAGTGNRDYDTSYEYSPDGNLVSRTADGTSTDYTYPQSGGDRPHAPTEAGGDDYVWGPNGTLSERTVDGATEAFTWSPEGQLAGVSGPDGTDSYIYDAGGARLSRTTPEGRTLYIAGHEVTANLEGTQVTAVRSYAFGGAVVATRTSAGVDYLVTDQQGSVQASVAAGAADPGATASYAPFGAKRDSTGDFTTDRSWIGQVHDSSTELAYLNARL